jgi:hypothetical protein
MIDPSRCSTTIRSITYVDGFVTNREARWACACTFEGLGYAQQVYRYSVLQGGEVNAR